MKINLLARNIFFSGKKVNVIYFNDMHGSTKNLTSFADAHDEFYKKHKDEPNYTLCGGDMFLDTSKNNKTVASVMSKRIDAAAIGNHDLTSVQYFNNLLKQYGMKRKWLSANLYLDKSSNLKKDFNKSIIVEKEGTKIGVIGVSPLEYRDVIFLNDENRFVNVMPIDKTCETIKNEVSKLEKKGVNKIFLIAHTGEYDKNHEEKYYEKFAKIGGIDVIIGGHDHLQVNKWLVSSRGEPVKVVSTGKSKYKNFGGNLDVYGILNLDFDDDGVLIRKDSKNKFVNLKTVHSDKNFSDKALYELEKPLKDSNSLLSHSETANLTADACLWYVNHNTKGPKADFAFVNGGTIRSCFDNKIVTADDIAGVVPFTTSTLIKAPLSKKQIINTLNWSALSTSFKKVSPGLMHTSGMEYTINPDLQVSDVHILNSDGTIKYNLDDFGDDDEFICVYDVFLATGPVGLKDLKTDCENNKNLEHFNVSRQFALEEYFKNGQISDYTQKRILFK